jgi:hypothetical protein
MNKRTLTIILAVVLIASFFLPWVSYGGRGVSGFDIVKAPMGDWKKYISLLIPISGLLLLIGAANNGNYPLGRNFLCWLPLLTVIWIIVVEPVLIDKQSFGDVIKFIGVGLWAATAASLVLAFYNPRN